MLERNIPLSVCCFVSPPDIKCDIDEVYKKSEYCDNETKTEPLHCTYIIEPPLPKEEKKELKEAEVKRKEFDAGKPKTGWRRYIGIFLVLIATMFYSLGTLIIKILQDLNYHSFSVSYIRFQGLLMPSASMMLYFRFVDKKPIFNQLVPLTQPSKLKTVILLVIRSIVGCSSTICHIYALKYISLADASVIAFSCPVFVIVIAHFIGMEKMGYTSVVVTCFTLCGVGIICRPPMLTGASEFNTEMLIGSGFAFCSMLLTSSVIILLRSLRGIHFSILMTSYGLFGTLECGIFALIAGTFTFPTTLNHWLLSFGLVGFTFLAQIALIGSLKYEEAGPVSLVQTTDSIFSFFWQYIAFSLTPDLYSLSGAAVVILGVGLTSLRKIVSNLPEDHKVRKVLSFILK